MYSRVKKNKTFSLDVDLIEKMQEEYSNQSQRVNSLIEEDLSIVDQNKDQELDRLKNELEETEEEIDSLKDALEKEMNRKERLENKIGRVKKKIEKREAEKEAKKDFYKSQLEKFHNKKSTREYSGIELEEKAEKFMDEFGSGLWSKFENRVDSDISRSEFRSEMIEYLVERTEF